MGTGTTLHHMATGQASVRGFPPPPPPPMGSYSLSPEGVCSTSPCLLPSLNIRATILTSARTLGLWWTYTVCLPSILLPERESWLGAGHTLRKRVLSPVGWLGGRSYLLYYQEGHLAKNEVTRGKGTGRQRGTLLTMSLEQLGPTIHKTKYFYLTPKLPFLLKPACVWFLKPKHSSQTEMGSTVWSLQPHCEVSTPLISR